MSRCKPLLRAGIKEPSGKKLFQKNGFEFRERDARSPTEAWEMGLAKSVVGDWAKRRCCLVLSLAAAHVSGTSDTFITA